VGESTMSFIRQAKDKIKDEYESYKVRRAIGKDPAYLKAEINRMKEIKKGENLQRELKELKNTTGTRGKIVSGLQGVRTYLNDVKVRNNKANGVVKSGVRNSLREQTNSGIQQSNLGMSGLGMHNNNLKGAGLSNQRFGTGSSLVTGTVGTGQGGVFGGSQNSTKNMNKKKNSGRTIVIKL
jgi:hypothetical protein